MKAVKFKGHNVIFAKDQKEYTPLPAHSQNDGFVTVCFKLNDMEFNKITRDKKITLAFMNFNRPAQPVKLWIEKPTLPINWEMSRDFRIDANKFNTETFTAEFTFDLNALDLLSIKSSKCIWISTITYNTPLQPISMQLS